MEAYQMLVVASNSWGIQYNNLLCIPPASCSQRSIIAWFVIGFENIRLIKREDRYIFTVAVAIPDLTCGGALDSDLGGSISSVSVEGATPARLNPS
jgi:hypothetical protein